MPKMRELKEMSDHESRRFEGENMVLRELREMTLHMSGFIPIEEGGGRQ